MKVREDFTITGKASTRTRCLNSVFVFNVKELKQKKAEGNSRGLLRYCEIFVTFDSLMEKGKSYH